MREPPKVLINWQQFGPALSQAACCIVFVALVGVAMPWLNASFAAFLWVAGLIVGVVLVQALIHLAAAGIKLAWLTGGARPRASSSPAGATETAPRSQLAPAARAIEGCARKGLPSA